VWSMASLDLLYVLKHREMGEFKICNGIMFLIFKQVGESLPMILLDVQTGKPL